MGRRSMKGARLNDMPRRIFLVMGLSVLLASCAVAADEAFSVGIATHSASPGSRQLVSRAANRA